MNALPHARPDGRPQRFNLGGLTPAVLRFEDGRRTKAQLEIISLTGGMLNLPKPVERESQVKLMFLTPTGPVLGTAEMLKPVSWRQQPFRFVALEHDDQRRLQASIQTSFGQADNKKEDEQQKWIEKYRAALDRRPVPRKHIFSSPLAAFALAMLSLGSAIYLFGIFDILSLHLK